MGHPADRNPLRMRSWFPPLRLRSGQALRKVREGRGTPGVGDASDVESLGHIAPLRQRKA
jgi:hypothetical protein